MILQSQIYLSIAGVMAQNYDAPQIWKKIHLVSTSAF